MVQAIIFDCFGVLTTDGWLPFKQKYFGHDPALLEQVTDLNRQADAGYIGYSDFNEALAELLDRPAHEIAREIASNVTNELLFAYIASLKPDYKLGLASNAARNWLPMLFTPEQVALFDAVALSCDVKSAKPQSRMYEVIADKLGVELEACIFVDDQERCVTGAQDVGMQALWYKDFEQLQHNMDKLLAK